MTQASEKPRDLVILIHGTGAARAAGTGDAWWQLSSPFSTALASAAEATLPRETDVFYWSGANSELQRLAGGAALLEFLRDVERRGVPYHLVGHSHGGSVIWHALQNSESGAPLKRLASWTTVGTPFLHFQPTVPRWWTFAPSVLAAYFIWSTRGHVPHVGRHWRDVASTAGLLSASWIGVLWVLLAVVVLLGVARLFRWSAAARGARVATRRSRAAWRRHGSRYLCIRSTEDEAIGGLTHTPALDLTLLPRLHANAGWWSRPPVRWVVRPALGLYNYFVGEAGDEFVAGRLMDAAQGNDLGAQRLQRVSYTPLGTASEPVDAEVDSALIASANTAASRTLGRFRTTFAATAAAGGLPALIKATQESFAFQELVHTSYFDHPRVGESIAAHVRRFAGKDAVESPPAESAGAVAAEALVPELRARDWAATLAATAIVFLLGTGIASAFAASYASLTDDFQARTVLEQARFRRVPADERLGLPVSSPDLKFLRAAGGIAPRELTRDVIARLPAEIERMPAQRWPEALAAYAAGVFAAGDVPRARRRWRQAMEQGDSVSEDATSRFRERVQVLSEVMRAGDLEFLREHGRELVRLHGDAQRGIASETTWREFEWSYDYYWLVLADRPFDEAVALITDRSLGFQLSPDLRSDFIARQLRPVLAAREATKPRGAALDGALAGYMGPELLARSISRGDWADALSRAVNVEGSCRPTDGNEAPDEYPVLSSCYSVAAAALERDQVSELMSAAGTLGIHDNLRVFAEVDSIARSVDVRRDLYRIEWMTRIHSLPIDTRDILLWHLTSRAIAANEEDAATNAVGMITSPTWGHPAARRVAAHLVGRGQIGKATRLVESDSTDSTAYGDLARAVVDVDGTEDATRFRRFIEDSITVPRLRHYALVELAAALAGAGHLREARLVVDENRSIPDEDVLRVYTRILQAYGRAQAGGDLAPRARFRLEHRPLRPPHGPGGG